MTEVPCVDATCSVDSSTSTGELHERVYAPHTRVSARRNAARSAAVLTSPPSAQSTVGSIPVMSCSSKSWGAISRRRGASSLLSSHVAVMLAGPSRAAAGPPGGVAPRPRGATPEARRPLPLSFASAAQPAQHPRPTFWHPHDARGTVAARRLGDGATLYRDQPARTGRL